MLGLAAVDVVLVVGDRCVSPATDEWAGGIVSSTGHVLLASFTLAGGVAVWRWDVGDVVLERELALAHGRPATAVVHRVLRADGPVGLELVPLCTWRDANGDRFAGPDPAGRGCERRLCLRGRVPRHRAGLGARWLVLSRRALREEAARGLDDVEDVFAAGRFRATLGAGESTGLVVLADDGDPPDAQDVVAAARARAEALVRRAGASTDVERLLCQAADQFVVQTSDGPSIYAGYPWFGEWSRDAMTSYEGVFPVTGRADEGRALLTRAADLMSDGLLADSTDPASRSSTPPTRRRGSCTPSVATSRGPATSISPRHEPAARLGPHARPRGHALRDRCRSLGRAAAPRADGWALTWMDARVDGVPVTSPAGKAVEINALWVNALATLAELPDARGGDGSSRPARHDRARASCARFACPVAELLRAVRRVGAADGL